MNDDALALAFRAGLPFVGLRDHEHDPALDDVIPPEAAGAVGAVVLAASDDHVRLAVAHPAVNLSALAPYVGDRRVELAIASRVELEAIVGPPRPLPPVVEEPLGEAQAPVEEQAPEEPLSEEEPVAQEALIEEEPAALEPAPVEVPVVEPEPEPEPEPEAEPASEAEPEPPPVARDEAQPETVPPGEEPSWLEAPSPRRRVLRIVLVLLLLLVIAGGALLAYLLTR